MASIGSLIVDLALESRNFIAGMRQAQAQTASTSSAISSAMNMAKGAVAGFAGIMTVDFLKDQTLKAFDYADAIVDLADRTGISTKMLQEFRYAAQMSGSSVESADAAVDKFAKNLGAAQNGNKAMAASFHELGVTSTDTDTALRQSMDGISKLGTITQKNQKSVELFGKSAADMTVMLSGGSAGFDQLAAAAQAYGIVIDGDILRNAGQVNDKLDTMKMIVDAQMANAIVQNADALVALANGFMTAATAAAHFFSQMDIGKLMSVANGINLNSDIPTMVVGRLQGKSTGQVADEARAKLKTTHDGRQALHSDLTQRYNEGIRSGRNKNDADMQAILAERSDIAAAEARSRHGVRRVGGGHTTNLPVPTAKPKPAPKAKTGPSAEDLAKKETQRLESYNRELFRATDDEISAREALSTNVSVRAGFERTLLANATKRELDAIDTDVSIGKLKKEEAEKLKALVGKTSESKLELINNEEADRLATEVLSIKNGQIENETDMLSGQQSLAKSQKERRAISLRLVDLEYEKEKIALQSIVDSKMSSDAEKQIAQARLNILDKLKGQSVEQAKRSTMGPMEEYLSAIPATLGEVNEALENVQVQGMQSLGDGFKDLLTGAKSFGDVFSGVLDTVLDGILQIVIQQALIKPIGSLLSGDGGGGGGFLGGIFKTLVKSVAGASIGSVVPSSIGTSASDTSSVSAMDSIKLPSLSGARANGGMTQPGDYLVGERGKEIVRIGSPANVIANHAVDRVSGANDNQSGPTINFGDITSNDPAAIKMAAFEAIAQAMPMIKQQSSDYTIGKLGRPGLR